MTDAKRPITLSAIAAVASNGVIGRNNALPWRISEDLHYFKRMTMGKPVIMGRASFESIGKPLPGRTNIVLTHRADFAVEGVVAVATVDVALIEAEKTAQGEIMVIGGAQIYTAFMPMLDRLYITRIDRAFKGDVFFPDVDWDDWTMTSEERNKGDPPFAFQIYERIRDGA